MTASANSKRNITRQANYLIVDPNLSTTTSIRNPMPATSSSGVSIAKERRIPLSECHPNISFKIPMTT